MVPVSSDSTKSTIHNFCNFDVIYKRNIPNLAGNLRAIAVIMKSNGSTMVSTGNPGRRDLKM